MTRRTLSAVLAAAMATALLAAPAAAQQSLNVQIGGFKALDASRRSVDDVLLADYQYLAFDIRDMKGTTVSADWSVLLGDKLEVGVGAGYFSKTVPSVWADMVYDDGSEIWQDITLRVAPITAQAKFFPLGARGVVQPYVGAGASLYLWHYREVGDFVDYTDNSVYAADYKGSGTAFGPVAIAGLRVRVGPAATVGVEGRYQWGKAKISTNEFLTDTLDLGGTSILATFGFRF